MSDFDKKKNLNISNIKPSKIITKKMKITPKKINLCKKYFYIDSNKAMNLKQFNNGKFLQLMGNDNKLEKGGDILEQVDYVMTQFEQKKTELNKKKLDCIKSMILNNKNIPEKWIMKPNYKQILNKAMEDEIVLNYAILCKDKHRKTAGLDQSDDERYLNYIKSLPPEKKFISYINPYSRNYCDSSFKKQIMNKYCLSLRRDNNNYKRIRYINGNSLNRYETNKKLYKKLSHDKITVSIGNISEEKNKLPMISNKSKINIDEINIKKRDINKYNNINETKDDLMVTSLHYNKYNKDKDNNTNNNNGKLPELPII